MIIAFLLACLVQRPITDIAAPYWDVISLTHVESILTAYRIPHTDSAGGHDVLAFAEGAEVRRLLDVEAPGAEFNLLLRGREVPADPGRGRWRLVQMNKPGGVVFAPFPLADMLAATGFTPGQVRRLEYFPRSYLGHDLRYHTGFEIRMETTKGPRHNQILGDEGKWLITDEDPHAGDFPGGVNLVPLGRTLDHANNRRIPIPNR